MILRGEVPDGSTVKVDEGDGHLTLSVVEGVREAVTIARRTMPRMVRWIRPIPPHKGEGKLSEL